MTESDIQAVEARVLPERETTRAIARRVMAAFGAETPDEVEFGTEQLAYAGLMPGELRDFAELLRRAAAGECDPEAR